MKTFKKSIVNSVFLFLICLSAKATTHSARALELALGPQQLGKIIERIATEFELAIDISDPQITQCTIEITHAERLTKTAAIDKLATFLSWCGLTYVYDSDLDLYNITRVREARDLNLPVYSADEALPSSEVYVNYVTTLKYFPADEAARILRNFMPPNTRVISFEQTNSLAFTHTAHSIQQYKTLVQYLDTAEVAKQAKSDLKRYATTHAQRTSDSLVRDPNSVTVVLLLIVSALLGFLLRGYVIRRIEGGL